MNGHWGLLDSLWLPISQLIFMTKCLRSGHSIQYTASNLMTLTQTPGFCSAPQPISATLSDMWPHQGVAMVTDKDCSCSKCGQGSQFGAKGWSGKFSTGDDWIRKKQQRTMRNIEENTKEIQRKYSVLQLLKEKFMKVHLYNPRFTSVFPEKLLRQVQPAFISSFVIICLRHFALPGLQDIR